ncbi:MAG: ABC transporter ATP-binding protein [Acidimicrobiia bacterium]|nr:ABC transporter ATP-binding protein [Acidimicrobiia bacterium]
MSAAQLLALEDLSVAFRSSGRWADAVKGVSMVVAEGETIGLVGESGCGKSATALAVLGLLPRAGRVTGGRVIFGGLDLLGLSRQRLRRIRGREIAMVFQDPATSLNPVLSIGAQVTEAVLAHQPNLGQRAARRRAIELLERVGVPDPAARIGDLPHLWSGGMKQRLMIAMAIANRPRLLIADEPTTALDVTIQAQVLALLKAVQQETGAALILITHDFGVVAEMADRVMVMYAGRMMETGSTLTVLKAPRNPYTTALLGSLPRLDRDRDRLAVIPGHPPSLIGTPSGCAFHPRCQLSGGRPRCRQEVPVLEATGPASHLSACHYQGELAGSAP